MYIFCNHNDGLAFDLYDELQRKKVRAHLVTAEELIIAKKWHHVIDEKGKASSKIILQNNDTLDSKQIDCAFNRIRLFQAHHFINASDRMYAEAEFYSLWISFLKTIDMLVEPVETHYLSLDQENQLIYFKKAMQAGLPVLNFHFTSSPKWKYTSSFLPFDPGNSISGNSDEVLQNLLWENRPVLLVEKHSAVIKILVIGSKIFSGERLDFDEAIISFSKAINRQFFEMYFVATQEGLKFSAINLFPIVISSVEMQALAEFLCSRSEIMQ